MLADFYFGYEDWKVFFICIIITSFMGGCLIISNSGFKIAITPREGFILLNTCWFTAIIFAALPFMFSSLSLSFVNSIFESVSGLTTTGSTVIDGLNYAPAGILLWRSTLQWAGGLGIIIMSISILPLLKIGGMQIFSSLIKENETVSSKTLKHIISILLLYSALTLICSLLYMGSGIGLFDSITHAMTTISTGGFSNYSQSFNHFNNWKTEIVATVFMLLGALPFFLCLRCYQEKKTAPLLKDQQVILFLVITAISILITFYYATTVYNIPTGRALRHSAFNVASVISGTGFMTGSMAVLSGIPSHLLFFLMMLGGCAGSTTGGIRIFRFQILYEITLVQIKKLIYPNGVFIPTYNNAPIPRFVPTSVMSFLFLYAMTYAFLALALSFIGLDVLTSISAAAGAISNAGGVGFGEMLGNGKTYNALPDNAKWIIAAGMYLGRVELFSVFILLSPKFWSR